MRFYAIRVVPPGASPNTVLVFDRHTQKFLPASAPFTWSSHTATGAYNPGALNVEMDIPIVAFNNFHGNIMLRVWGTGLPAISQANNLTNYDIEIFGGIKPPYVLNQTAPYGQLAAGGIFQGFGNWEGINQYLEFILVNKNVTPVNVQPITFSWKQGQDLRAAITAALQPAFPNNTFVFNITPPAATVSITSGTYKSLKAFGDELHQITANPPNYLGVSFYLQGTVFFFFDGTVQTNPIKIQFQDIIGQPTWISANQVSFATVMRSDILVGSYISFPQGVYPPYAFTKESAAYPGAPATDSVSFYGQFLITEVEHFGNYRQADASSWRTQYVCAVVGTPTQNTAQQLSYGVEYA